MQALTLFSTAVIIAAFACFVLLLLVKFNVLHYARTKAPYKLLDELVSCEFCMCFWLCLTATIVTLPGLTAGFIIVVVSTVVAKIMFNLATGQW